MFSRMKEQVSCGVNKVSAGVIALKAGALKKAVKKSEGVNAIVIAAILLLIALVAALVYWGFAKGVIQKVFDKINAAIDELFA